jgi:hypothetical protein
MASDVSQNAVSASLASIEANVVIAGVEAATGVWVIYAARTGQCFIPELANSWHWSFAFFAVLGFLAIIVAGFALEAAAGLIEQAIKVLRWYRIYTKQPDLVHTAKAQKWIWKSSQAYQEFSRRRLRILVARNTATFLLLFTVSWLLFVSWSLWLLAGLSGSVMFAWLWFDAQKAWNLAVNMTNQLGEP